MKTRSDTDISFSLNNNCSSTSLILSPSSRFNQNAKLNQRVHKNIQVFEDKKGRGWVNNVSPFPIQDSKHYFSLAN